MITTAAIVAANNSQALDTVLATLATGTQAESTQGLYSLLIFAITISVLLALGIITLVVSPVPTQVRKAGSHCPMCRNYEGGAAGMHCTDARCTCHSVHRER